MPYIPSYERLAEAKGLQEGRVEGQIVGLRKSIKLVLEVNFGEDGIAIAPLVDRLSDIERLEELQEKLVRKQLLIEDVRAFVGDRP